MKVTFAPGPSQPYPKLDEFMHDALHEGIVSMSHRSPAFGQLFAETTTNLKRLLEIPEDYHVWFLGSATEGMERSIENLVKKSSHHFITGAFGQKYYDIAAQIGKKPTKTELDSATDIDLQTVKVPKSAEMIAITLSETSAGISLDKDQIGHLRQRFPDKLISVDVVSAVPHLTLDYSQVDTAFFSVQKGFGLPAGLGVLVVSPRALERAEELAAEGSMIGSYHNFLQLVKSAAKNNTPETPNLLGIYLLNRVAKDMLDNNVVELRQRLDDSAERLYKALDQHDCFELSVGHQPNRARTIIVAKVLKNKDELFEYLASKDLAIGSGYKDQKESHVRIANFPAHLDYIDKLIDELNNWH